MSSTAVYRQRAEPVARVRELGDLIDPAERLVATSASLVASHDLRFTHDGEEYVIPRYIFLGPQGGDAPTRLGIFAGVHGDEPEGARAAVLFLKLLEVAPQLATGYSVTIYPVCNPTGYEDNTRLSRNGKDLNREFWRNSSEPEVRLLEAEITSRSFDGIIALHTDDTSQGFYGYARGATLTRHLIEPALASAERLLPRDSREVIDGFRARNGIIFDCFEGVLSAPPKARPRPFEIVLETPKAAPNYVKDVAFVAALQAILLEYRALLAYAPNL
jgi:protein MpaA